MMRLLTVMITAFALVVGAGVALETGVTDFARANGGDEDTYEEGGENWGREPDCASGPAPDTDEYWAAEGTLWWEVCVTNSFYGKDLGEETDADAGQDADAEQDTDAPCRVDAGHGGER